MKKKLVLMSVAAAVSVSAVIGGTLAGFNTQSELGKTDITMKELDLDLIGDGVLLDERKFVADACMPGSEVEMPYYVVNNVEDGYDFYTRVIIDKYWKDKDNEKLDADMITLYVKDAQGNAVEIPGESETGTAVRMNDWFVQYADEEQVVLYYAKPLAPGESTGNVLDYITIAESAGNAYTNQQVVLEVRTDAVQKIAAESAIPSEWGVYPEFDEDGNMVSITE